MKTLTTSVNPRELEGALLWLVLVALIGFGGLGFGQARSPFSGPDLFYDADRTGISKGQKILEGNVVLIAAGNVLAADKIVLDDQKKRIDATGHVVFIGTSQIISGQKISYQLETSDFKVEKAVMSNSDPRRIEKLRNKILGFSSEELRFEKDRVVQLQSIRSSKKELQREARAFSASGKKVPEKLIDRYAILLHQEELVTKQDNPSLAALPADRRKILKSRRNYWSRSRNDSIELSKKVAVDGYFRLEGDQIHRNNGNDYLSQESRWTPCRCEDDENPAWAFRSDSAFAQQGGYIDLHHPILEIKGVPVMYFPYLKLPLKDQRQSGFLPPTIAYDNVSGNIFSQPVFFDFADNADATVFTDIFERRGTRLGVEMRYQQRKYSGWDMRFESIRDRLWLDSRGIREDLFDYYSNGLNSAVAKEEQRDTIIQQKEDAERANDVDAEEIIVPRQETEVDLERIQNNKEWARLRLRQPDYWKNSSELSCLTNATSTAECHRTFSETFNVPTNTWRGQMAWRGLTLIAPRLSLVSHGEIVSDHRYADELFLPDDVREAFFTTDNAKSFNVAKAQIHLDNPHFYLGVGGRFGDHVLLEERYAGQQVPIRFKTQSRMFNLLPTNSAIPVYSQISFEQLRITQYGEPVLVGTPSPTLGSGGWRNFKFDAVSPLLSDTTISVNQFTEFEARFIDAAALGGGTNEIRSWRTGLDFRLPIDGKGKLPAMLQPDQEGDDFVHHLMDWGLGFSLRPNVVRRGPYGDPDTELGQFAYFASDGFDDGGADVSDVREDTRLEPHQRITFSTNHSWRLFKRSWDVVSGKPKSNEVGRVEISKKERARQELLYSLDRPVSSVDDLFDGSTWLVNRYKREDKYYADPVSLAASITYDLLRVKVRERERQENQVRAQSNQPILARIAQEQAKDTPDQSKIDSDSAQLQQPLVLTEPWIGPNLSLNVRALGLSLKTDLVYSVYLKEPRKMAFTLGLPSVFETSLSLAYTIDKVRIPVELDFQDIQTKVRNVSLVSNIIPYFNTFWSFSVKEIDQKTLDYNDAVEMRSGFEYSSPSECWRLRFRRDKEYGRNEASAKYVLQLSVIFLGSRERALGNFAPNLERQLGKQEDQENI